MGETVINRTGSCAIAYQPPPARALGALSPGPARAGDTGHVPVGAPDPVAAGTGGDPAAADQCLINERLRRRRLRAGPVAGRGDISGNLVGVRNAAAMVGDLVDPATGEIAPVLGLAPNGVAHLDTGHLQHAGRFDLGLRC